MGDTSSKRVVISGVKTSDLGTAWATTLDTAEASPLGAREPAIMIAKMDSLTPWKDRVAARKGKRRHIVEREWARIWKAAAMDKRKATLAESRKLRHRGRPLPMYQNECSVRSFTCSHGG